MPAASTSRPRVVGAWRPTRSEPRCAQVLAAPASPEKAGNGRRRSVEAVPRIIGLPANVRTSTWLADS